MTKRQNDKMTKRQNDLKIPFLCKCFKKEEESERVSGLLFRTRWQSQYQGRVVDSKVVYTCVSAVRFSSAFLHFLTNETSSFLSGSQLTPSSFTSCSLTEK